ncbi:MAG: hypothetical protein P1U46_00140 [Patescibacteria group bacterium]|nr:hypothetical protein [Patescibacteria group bacterium]
MSEFLASETVTKDPKLDELREIWNNVNNYSFSKENETIDELYKFNIDKFSKIKDILNNELIINKNLEKKLDNPFILKISDNNSSLIDSYKKEMSYFNEITK